MAIIVLSRRPIKFAERVDCPKCGEKAPWACRAKSGRSTDTHVARRELAYTTPPEDRWGYGEPGNMPPLVEVTTDDGGAA